MIKAGRYVCISIYGVLQSHKVSCLIIWTSIIGDNSDIICMKAQITLCSWLFSLKCYPYGYSRYYTDEQNTSYECFNCNIGDNNDTRNLFIISVPHYDMRNAGHTSWVIRHQQHLIVRHVRQMHIYKFEITEADKEFDSFKTRHQYKFSQYFENSMY